MPFSLWSGKKGKAPGAARPPQCRQSQKDMALQVSWVADHRGEALELDRCFVPIEEIHPAYRSSEKTVLALASPITSTSSLLMNITSICNQNEGTWAMGEGSYNMQSWPKPQMDKSFSAMDTCNLTLPIPEYFHYKGHTQEENSCLILVVQRSEKKC